MYEALGRALVYGGECLLSQTLRHILTIKQNKKFRVCILGGKQIRWDTVLEYKRRKILIDTGGTLDYLSQVSYTTGGISRKISPQNIIRTFLIDYSKPT